MSTDMPRDVFDSALLSEFEAVAAARMPAAKWSPALDATIIDAHDRLGLSFGDIARGIMKLHGWGSETTISRRYHAVKGAK